MKISRTVVLFVALLTMSACGAPTGDADWAGTMTDSAGITIVHNPTAGMWAPGEAWSVEEVFSVGSIDGSPEEQFGQIIGVDVDPDGNVYIADSQTREIRVFDATGVYQRTIGRPGSGPGELGLAVTGVFVAGESLLVPDLGNARVNRYDFEGVSVGSSRLDFTQGVPVRWDRTSGGRILAQLRSMNFSDSASAAKGDAIVVFDDSGTILDTLMALPIGESLQFTGGAPRIRIFEPEPIWDAGSDGRIVMSRNSEVLIHVHGPDGTLERIVTLHRERKELTERDREVMKRAIADAARQQGAPPATIEQVMSQMEFADHYPLFATLAVGPHGSLWMQRVRTGTEIAGEEDGFDAQDIGSNQWDVFDGEGRYLGVVEFPGKFQPIQAMGDLVYGIARDELDVQSLKVFRIRSGP